MSIASNLEQILSPRFPDLVKANQADQTAPIVRIAFPHAPTEVFEIFDEGHEATTLFGSFTHCHFSCFTPGITDDQRHKEIAQDLSVFLDELFSDRVLVWKSLQNGSGGWLSDFDLSNLSSDRVYMLWSRPVPATHAPKAKWWSGLFQKA